MLFNRLSHPESGKIAIHGFMSALGEYARGEIVQADIVSFWKLDAGEEADLRTFFLDKQDAKAKAGDDTREYASVVHDVLILGEIGFPGYANADDLTGKLKALL